MQYDRLDFLDALENLASRVGFNPQHGTTTPNPETSVTDQHRATRIGTFLLSATQTFS